METLAVLLKLALVVFMAGNLLGMGLRLDLRDALAGLRHGRFVAASLVSSFLVGPALAWTVARAMPLEAHYGAGLVLIGLAPCAPFLPTLVERARGDQGHAAALMLLASVGTVLLMPLALPLMLTGLTVSAWVIARPLIVFLLLPLGLGMTLRRLRPSLADRLHPPVKRITTAATIAVLVLCAIVYGEGIMESIGSFALLSLLIFVALAILISFLLAFGLPRGQRVVLVGGAATRNLGAAIAPLFAVGAEDQRAMIMIALALPVTLAFGLIVAKRLGAPEAAQGGESR